MQLVSAPKACFPLAVPFTSPITALRQIADVFSKRPIRLEFKTPGFGFGKFLFRQCRFFRFAFPAPLLFELDLRRILAADRRRCRILSDRVFDYGFADSDEGCISFYPWQVF